MAKFIKKPIIVEAITFSELVKHGLTQCEFPVNGMPWSFEYGGHNITHENDECYLIPSKNSDHARFTPNDMLITGVDGELYSCPLEVFLKSYDPAEASP